MQQVMALLTERLTEVFLVQALYGFIGMGSAHLFGVNELLHALYNRFRLVDMGARRRQCSRDRSLSR